MHACPQRTRSEANPKGGAVKIGSSGTQIHPLASRAYTCRRSITASSTDDARVLAKRLQNPIGDRYSFLFPNNTNFNAALSKGTLKIALPRLICSRVLTCCLS
jgi:hypothetical protein